MSNTRIYKAVKAPPEERVHTLLREHAAEVERLTAQILALTDALSEEWEINHAEHCSGVLDANGECSSEHGCQWPRPSVLAGAGE